MCPTLEDFLMLTWLVDHLVPWTNSSVRAELERVEEEATRARLKHLRRLLSDWADVEVIQAYMDVEGKLDSMFDMAAPAIIMMHVMMHEEDDRPELDRFIPSRN